MIILIDNTFESTFESIATLLTSFIIPTFESITICRTDVAKISELFASNPLSGFREKVFKEETPSVARESDRPLPVQTAKYREIR